MFLSFASGRVHTVCLLVLALMLFSGGKIAFSQSGARGLPIQNFPVPQTYPSQGIPSQNIPSQGSPRYFPAQQYPIQGSGAIQSGRIQGSQPSQGSRAFQGSQTQGSQTKRPERRDPQAIFRQQFWTYLTNGQQRYDEWGRFPGKSADIYEGESPHGKFLRLYANKIARTNPATLPYGSILIKENYAADKSTLMAVTVMYRVKGFDAKANDWYWIKYQPNGSVALTPPENGSKPIAGKFSSCIDCHREAGGDDFTFANDR